MADWPARFYRIRCRNPCYANSDEGCYGYVGQAMYPFTNATYYLVLPPASCPRLDEYMQVLVLCDHIQGIMHINLA